MPLRSMSPFTGFASPAGSDGKLEPEGLTAIGASTFWGEMTEPGRENEEGLAGCCGEAVFLSAAKEASKEELGDGEN